MCGCCAPAYLFAGLYAVSSGGDRRLTYAIWIEGRAKRRLGAVEDRAGYVRDCVLIIQLCAVTSFEGLLDVVQLGVEPAFGH